jgi:hypothetical protein
MASGSIQPGLADAQAAVNLVPKFQGESLVKQIRKRLTYANVMSTIAVFLVVGGASALAAAQLAKNSVGTKQLKSNAVTTAKIKKEAVSSAKLKNEAVTTAKLKNGAVTTAKLGSGAVANGNLADGSVSTGKIAEGAVSANKLAAGERSEALQVAETSGTVQLEDGLLGTFGPAQAVVTINLPAGNFVVTAQTEFINTKVGETLSATCRLFDGETQLSEQSATILPGLLFPSGGVTTVGISDGGTVFLACRATGTTKNIFAFQRRIVATRVNSVG